MLRTAILAIATAVGLLTYETTGREIDLGDLGLAEFVPTLLFGLLGRSFADRDDRRLVAVAWRCVSGRPSSSNEPTAMASS